jgi:hypothetical protein
MELQWFTPVTAIIWNCAEFVQNVVRTTPGGSVELGKVLWKTVPSCAGKKL